VTRKFATINGNTSRGENSASGTTNTLGLNWILNPHARVMFNYAETIFGTKVTYLSTTNDTTKLGVTGYTDKEKIFSVRTQLSF
jgi:phosphate-selective porin